MRPEGLGSPSSDLRQENKVLRLRAVPWSLATAFAGFHIWTSGSYVNPDGVSYLDIADAYRRGDWSNAINAYWSPMYSWVLAGWLGLLKPSRAFEARSVYFLEFFIYVASLSAFEFFLTQLLMLRGNRTDGADDLVPVVPDSALRLLGYGVFVWTWFFWLRIVTPDLLMTVFVYIAAGLLLRIRAGEQCWLAFAALGASLAFGYLAKTAMFLLSFVFLGVAWLAIRKRPKAGLRVLVALVAFVAVAGPWIAVLSTSKHRMTFGDAGRINYVVYSNGFDNFPDEKNPLHPTLRVLERPALFAIPSKAPGSYPFHYDVAYWSEGLRPHFQLRAQLRATYQCAKDAWAICFSDEPFLFAGVFILGFLYWDGGKGLRHGMTLQWVILLPAVSAIVMYSLVHVEPRLIGVFVVLIWLGVYAALYRPAARDSDAAGRAVALAVMLAMGIRVEPDPFTAFNALRKIGRPVPASANRDWEVARSLAALGVRPGDRVAKVGHGNAYWARLAGVQIVAEVHSEKESFELVPDSAYLLDRDGSMTSSAISGFVSTGARAIIACNVPRSVADHGWTRLGRNDVGTADLYAYILPRGRDTQTQGPKS
jgi:hypothetical protein